MKFEICAFLAIFCFGFIIVRGDDPALCESWSSIEQKLKSKDIPVSCTTSNDCFGVNCTGSVKDHKISTWIQLHGCEDPPYVQFKVDAPQLKLNNIKKKLYHNETIHMTRNINLEFKIEREGQMLVFGLTVHFLNLEQFSLSVFPVISDLKFPINCQLPAETSNLSSTVNQYISQQIPLPSKSLFSVGIGDGYSNCSIINSTCHEEEMCQQINKLKPDGICVCITNYTRNADGVCVFNNQEDENSSVSLLLTAILVPILVILPLLVAAVYITVRFGVFRHFRRRLRVQVYEHVHLGDDETEDTSNPVI